jgi:menaquinone-9 beta-reductase
VPSNKLRVIGAGPAGSAAAIAALQLGATVEIFEKTAFPRHKVCGEFLSPESVAALKQLGVWQEFQAKNPAVIRAMELHFPSVIKRTALPEPAYGCSRFALDALLLNHAIKLGAELNQEAAEPVGSPTVIAYGRKSAAPKGSRLFGFKAHYSGPPTDAVELYFLSCGGYVGLSAVEGGATNVCGLAPESVLTAVNFEVEEIFAREQHLRERLAPLSRIMPWLRVGPMVFGNRLHDSDTEGHYLAGDALSFVDPFTGTGMTAALLSGRLAGEAAVRGIPLAEYLRHCREVLEKPFQFSSLFRLMIDRGWADPLVRLFPGKLLFRLTRPRSSRTK